MTPPFEPTEGAEWPRPPSLKAMAGTPFAPLGVLNTCFQLLQPVVTSSNQAPLERAWVNGRSA